ncbi:MAG: type III pantothenate kinase, partial [Betaproteobacteria bacterium]|nr:type III pantothenate kinase [Betaproteobacteria bacterium]
MSFLAIDVGNTRLKWAMYDRPHPQAHLLAHGAEFLENIESLSEGPWASLPAPGRMLGCIVAGDAVRRRVQEQMELWDVAPQWVVSSVAEAGLSNGYDHPSRLGSDRWVAMIGARQRMLAQGAPRPLVVVMVGTAVTVEAIDQHGRFLGGFILPGHGIMLRALESGTAGLHVPTGDVRLFPTNTSDALTSGGTFAIAGACERMVQHLREHTGMVPMCIMTGGAGWKMAPS